MSETDLFNERLYCWENKKSGGNHSDHMTSKQSLSAKFDEEFARENNINLESNATGNWCEVVSSFSNVNAKQAWKNGTEKLTQTFNNFRTTFGVLSQRIKKSTKKRQPLVNMDSPVTPYTRSRAALGRTPTKLYSPFSIDTPKGKENNSSRFSKEEAAAHSNTKSGKKKPRRTRLDLGVGQSSFNTGEAVLSNDSLQTQIGIYEFQSVANRIVQNGSNF